MRIKGNKPKVADYSQSPYFFVTRQDIARVLPLMAAILIFKCTEGAGVGDYSSRGRGAKKNRGTVITSQGLSSRIKSISKIKQSSLL